MDFYFQAFMVDAYAQRWRTVRGIAVESWSPYECSMQYILVFANEAVLKHLRQPGFDTRLGHVDFVNEMPLGRIISKYFGFPCQFSFYRRLHIH
jgi:hypothetical protein